MYNFSYFKEKDKQAILDFIEEYPFAFMTGSFASGRQVATQIPSAFLGVPLLSSTNAPAPRLVFFFNTKRKRIAQSLLLN